MRITWRDGVTTLATAGALVLERAYFHQWNWPLVSELGWVIVGLAVLILVSFISSFLLDSSRSRGWTIAASIIGLTALALTGLGLYYMAADYVVLLMLTAVVFWIASILEHLVAPTATYRGHGRRYA